MKTSNKDVNKLITKLIKAGWGIINRGKHPMLISPKGRKVIVSSTPRDRGYLKVLKGCINRAMR